MILFPGVPTFQKLGDAPTPPDLDAVGRGGVEIRARKVERRAVAHFVALEEVEPVVVADPAQADRNGTSEPRVSSKRSRRCLRRPRVHQRRRPHSGGGSFSFNSRNLLRPLIVSRNIGMPPEANVTKFES